MDNYLKTYDLHDLIKNDIEKEAITKLEIEATSISSVLSSISSLVSKKLTQKYKDAACFFFESDHEHCMEYFMSNVENIDYNIDKDGLKINANINRSGRHLKHTRTFYDLIKNRISQKDLDELIKSRRRVLGSSTLHKKPTVQITPRKIGCMDDFLYIVKDGEEIYKHTF